MLQEDYRSTRKVFSWRAVGFSVVVVSLGCISGSANMIYYATNFASMRNSRGKALPGQRHPPLTPHTIHIIVQ